MTVSESDRRDIYTGLEASIGIDAANNLMKLLPHQPADQLVTRTDMHAQTQMLRGEMAELRGELRTEMAELRSELRGEMAELRGEVVGLLGEHKGLTQRLFGASIAVNAVALATAGFL